MSFSGTLRGLSIATVAMPLAIANLGSSRTEDRKEWRPRAAITDQDIGGFPATQLKVVRIVGLDEGSASLTSTGDLIQSPFDQGSASASEATSESYDVDWLNEALIQIGELIQVSPEDLPNEAPLRHAAITKAVKIVLDLQHTHAPAPQIAPRGDGGLQFVWYTEKRDLEFEVGANGLVEIVEFDGVNTTRVRYTLGEARQAILRVRDSLDGVSAAT